jgi:hypothetical protein
MRAGSGQLSGASATYKGTPHTQYATEHHAGDNHGDAANNPKNDEFIEHRVFPLKNCIKCLYFSSK